MATLADLPLGATILIPVETDENRLCEIADKDNLTSGGAVLVYKKIYEKSKFGDTPLYPDGTLDNLIKNTIYNSFPQAVREKMMNVTFALEGSGSITRKVFALTYTMMGFGTNNGTTEGKALQHYNRTANRIKTYDGSAGSWWLSSQAGLSYSSLVHANGTASSNYPSFSRGVVPAFAIPGDTLSKLIPNTDGSYNLIL